MKWTSVSKTISVTLFAFVLAHRMLGDDVPTFNEPDINAFVKFYAQFADDYLAAYNAMKAGKASKIRALQAKSGELQAETTQIMEKLKPGEAEKFSDFIVACARKISGLAEVR
jgi:hypothetical protein